MSSDNATEAAVTPQEWLRGHASGIADRDGEVSLLNATIRELTVEIERLRVEANELRQCPNCIPLEAIPAGWRFISCIQSAGGGEWWVQLEGPEKPWPVRTAGAWGPTLRAAVERACWEAGAG